MLGNSEHSGWLPCVTLFYIDQLDKPQNNPMNIPILWMKKWMHREVNWFTQGHATSKYRSQDLNQVVCLWSPGSNSTKLPLQGMNDKLGIRNSRNVEVYQRDAYFTTVFHWSTLCCQELSIKWEKNCSFLKQYREIHFNSQYQKFTTLYKSFKFLRIYSKGIMDYTTKLFFRCFYQSSHLKFKVFGMIGRTYFENSNTY